MQSECDKLVDEILALLAAGEVSKAKLAIEELTQRYGFDRNLFGYAFFEVDALAKRYDDLGRWKETCATYEQALLTVRDVDGRPYPGTAEALFSLAQTKRFLGRSELAIPLLNEVLALVGCYPSPGLEIEAASFRLDNDEKWEEWFEDNIGDETSFRNWWTAHDALSSLEQCYRDIGDRRGLKKMLLKQYGKDGFRKRYFRLTLIPKPVRIDSNGEFRPIWKFWVNGDIIW